MSVRLVVLPGVRSALKARAVSEASVGGPEVCCAYHPDALCGEVAAPTRAERVQRYLAYFGLEEEAARVTREGETSMRAAREPRPTIC